MSLSRADVPVVADPPAARPYGVLGLVVSSALILVGACLIFAIFAALAALALVGAFGWQAVLDRVGHPDASDQPKLVLVASMPVYAAIVAAVLVAARIRGGSRWRDLVAFKPWNPLRGAAWMWGLTAAMIVWGALANAAIEHLRPGVNPLDHLPTGLRWRFVVLILAAVFAPIAEETLFRGWIYTSLRASIGVLAAVLLVSALFAAAHWESTHLYALAVFPVGLALAYARERTGSVKTSMLMHAVYNGFGALSLFLTK